jgi:hypothetical protein
MLSLDLPLRPMHEVVEGIDKNLSGIILKMLEKDTQKRYATADDVMSDLGMFLFEKGYGPTTKSLADYIWLLKHSDVNADESMRQELRFLNWNNDIDPVRPAYKLTTLASDAIASGINPCRIPDDNDL